MPESSKHRLWLLLPLTLSLSMLIAAVVLIASINSTPFDTQDSAGRTMRFNDTFSPEHYTIALRNFNMLDLFEIEYALHGFIFAMHLIAALVIISPQHFGTKRGYWFFAAQPLVILFAFPFAYFGFVAMPFLLAETLSFQMDREGFVDVPFVSWVAHPVWLTFCLLSMLAMPGDTLGIKRAARFVSERVRCLRVWLRFRFG